MPVWAQGDKKITVALVGVAHIHTPGYLDELKKHPDVQVKYVWDHDPKRAERSAEKVGAQAVPDVKTIWSDPEITAVIILSETNRHYELVLAAAAAGKHLFVEKPLGITADESRTMAAAIEKGNLIFTTGYFMRTDPKHLFLKSEIEKGNFGNITRVRGLQLPQRFAGRAGSTRNGAGWPTRKSPAWAPSATWARTSWTSSCGCWATSIRSPAEIHPVTGRYGDCDETGEALIQFNSGVIGTLAAGWVDIEDPVKLLISGTEGQASS